MRLTLANDDGELLATWRITDRLTVAQVEEAIADGFLKGNDLDRCDDCGGFFPADAMAQRHGAAGPEALCPGCASKALEE